ncbi:MAG TPA: efflux RND transporter periplasmic adaptor subunit [Candidatus Acidoferrales bacterium]|nr:efflux RND transporter periplasmic adaptor subunit [Candidatus Acidoferrales bacterium]
MRWKLAAIVGLLVVASVAIGFSAGLFKPSATAATTFLTAAVTTSDVTDEVTATGSVASTETYALAFGAKPVVTAASASSSSDSSGSSNNGSSSGPSVAWPVTEVDVKVGDRVADGQVLAKAASTDLEAQIAEADLTAKSAAIQLKQAQTGLDNATTTDAIRQAKVGLYSAQSSKTRADTALAELVALRPLATLTAPGAGIVTAVAISDGDDAPSGTAITVAAAALQVTTNVVESDVASISVGQAATVTVGAIDATLQGTVATIAPTASAASGSNGVVEYAVEITLDAPPPALRSGMSADVSIVTATAPGVLAIPSRALSGSAGSYTVRVVAADGSVSTRAVEVGLVTASLAEITSGLQAGERVVTGTSSSQQTVNGTTNGRGGFFGGGGGGVVVPGR